MLREKIIALSLGALCAAVGGILVLKGVLPGLVLQKPAPQQIQSESTRAPAPAKVAAIPAAPLPKPGPLVPQFDTVRVEPSGDTVVAGHGEPEAKITLFAGQTILGDAKADDGGDFVIVPQPLSPGNYVLMLSSISAGAAAVVSQQSITVSVPAKGQSGVVVALVQPGKPSQLLTDPTAGQQQTASAQQPQTSNATSSDQKPIASAQGAAKPSSQASAQANVPRVAIKTAEVDKGAFYAAGFAPAGTHVRIYLNGSALADVTAGANGAWSLTIGRGVTAGHYVVRADALGENGKVAARAEVPFDVPVAVAQEATPKPTANASATANPDANANANANAGAGTSGAHGNATVTSNAGAGQDQHDQNAKSDANPAPDTSHAVVAQIDTATVTRGDSLWRISQRELGEGIRYTLIYQVNASQIRDPNLIYPGQVFVMPHTN